MAVVAFDPAAFRAVHPSFATLTDTQLNYAFMQAGLYVNNTDCSVVQDVAERALLLDLMTAHIAALTYGENGQGPRPLVGRVSSATEGSVSVQAAMDGVPGTAAWFMQTQYGAMFWQATAKYRIGRYVPPPVGLPFPFNRPWQQ